MLPAQVSGRGRGREEPCLRYPMVASRASKGGASDLRACRQSLQQRRHHMEDEREKETSGRGVNGVYGSIK